MRSVFVMAEQNTMERNSNDCEDCESLSHISGNTLERARSELGEDPETRSKLIQELRDNLTQWKPLTIEEKPLVVRNVDNKFLLMFLRARKFDVSKALQLYISYHKFRHKHSQLLSKPVGHVFQSGIIKVLDSRALDGSKVICIYPGNWNASNVSFLENFHATFVVLDELIQDEMTQVHGFSILYDFTSSSFLSMLQVAQSEQITKGVLIDLLQDAFPARFKAVHLIHHPWYISIVLSVIKPFMKQKLRDRIHSHGEEYSSLHEHIDPMCLPEEFGGVADSGVFMDIISTFVQKSTTK